MVSNPKLLPLALAERDKIEQRLPGTAREITKEVLEVT
jgi:hypothetical protein